MPWARARSAAGRALAAWRSAGVVTAGPGGATHKAASVQRAPTAADRRLRGAPCTQGSPGAPGALVEVQHLVSSSVFITAFLLCFCKCGLVLGFFFFLVFPLPFFFLRLSFISSSASISCRGRSRHAGLWHFAFPLSAQAALPAASARLVAGNSRSRFPSFTRSPRAPS